MANPAGATGFLKDARHGQIIVLSTLLALGARWFGFDIRLWNVLAAFGSVLATQALLHWLLKPQGSMDFRSPLITGLSLTLLLRADGSTLLAAWPMAAAGSIAIMSKFTLRIGGKHLFNPANAGIVAMIVSGYAWTTPGQWGPMALGAALMAGVGFLVTYKAARLDVPIVFLGTFAGLLIARALWLGDPLTIPLLNLQNGALLLFAFFMISDPRTTPDHFMARWFFTALIAAGAYLLQYHFYQSEGLFFALFIGCLIRPLFDHFFPAAAFQWPQTSLEIFSMKGKSP